MNASIELYAQQFAGCSFEGGIRRVRVRPLYKDAFVQYRTGRAYCRSRRVTRDIKAREICVVGYVGTWQRGIFDVNRVEFSVSSIVRIEIQRVQAAAESSFDEQLAKDARFPFSSVEVQIDRGFSCVSLDDIQRTVQIRNEQTIRATRFFPQAADPREQRVVVGLSID